MSLCNLKERGIKNFSLLQIQTMCNNFCSLYPTNPALLQQLGVTVLIEHESLYPCEIPNNTYLLVFKIFIVITFKLLP